MRTALSIVEKCCGEVQLTINPEKAEAVRFTRKYKARPVRVLKLFEKGIKVSKEAKYLGVVLDSKSNWSRHLEYARTWEGHSGLLGLQESLGINVGARVG